MRERSPLFPDLPTIHEQGVTGFGTESWYALVGPAGMPPNVVAKYNGELRLLLAEPEIQEFLVKQGISVRTGCSEERGRAMVEEYEVLAELVREANIKGE